MARLQEKYRTQVAPSLGKALGKTNAHAIPRITKVVVNMGVGSTTQDRKRLEEAANNLATITGQRPLITKAMKAISSFRLRQGMEIGPAGPADVRIPGPTHFPGPAACAGFPGFESQSL